jgi:outer membrane lipoprotein-sorting protein
MSNTNETRDQGCLDHNLDRLLELGEPAPGMPEDLKVRIRSKLAEAGQESVKKRILPSRWAVWPLAATVVAAVILIVIWYGNSSKAIAWADVQGHLDQIHTLTLSAIHGISTTTGIQITERNKVYYKDPGLSRIEEYPPDAGSGQVEKGPRKIRIIRREPDSNEGVTLYPGTRQADLFDSVFLTDSSKPPSQPPMEFASFNWEMMKNITADKTRRIGDRVINDIPAVGFEFEFPDQGYVNPDRQVRAQLWASGYDGTPLLIEVEYRDPLGQNMRTEYSDFRWNVPLDESLFDLAVPEGWSFKRSRTESAEYANAGLAPGVILQIGPDGWEPLTETEDVTGVVRGEQITHPDSDIPSDVRITIELKPEAIQRLRDYARAHPDELMVVNFNGQIKVVPNLYGAGPSQLSFDLSLLDLSLAQLEARYFTTTIERNGL